MPLTKSRGAAQAQILVADDEPSNLELVSDTLAAHPWAVTAVSSGDAAMRALGARNPQFDLVILDRRMAAPDGMEILRFIRAAPQLSRMPVIMQTAAAEPALLAEGIEAGADYYLTKPFKGSALVALVRVVLARWREAMRLREQVQDLTATVALLSHAEFRFRTVDEARALAHGLAGLCEAPEMVHIGLTELLVNAVEHGNLGIGFDAKGALMQSGRWRDETERRLKLPQYRGRVARVQVETLTDLVRFVIRDEGAGFDWRSFFDMPQDRATLLNGRGIALARNLSFLSVNYRDEGREVEVTAAPGIRLRA